jgi:alpha-N-arabinofuranosidase
MSPLKKALSFLCSVLLSGIMSGQTRVAVHETAPDQPVIPKEIYGQFAEHLGRCIYDGIWVGKDSAIPNIDGYRKDLVEALRTLKVPVLRWPGGCFADEYHWMDGIGPAADRPKIVNTHWGGTLEDNSFGTHEFLDFCEMLGIEPYISGNVGSGTVEELSKWVEYMTARSGSMAELRARNGRKEPWKVKYIGVGNENWGCGGHMTPEFYSDQYRRYATYCRNYDGNKLYKVACGASDYDYKWTEVLMRNVRSNISGLSLHYYTGGQPTTALEFSEEDYYNTLGKAVEVEEVLKKHEAIMDLFDPQRKIDLLLDEWGTWFRTEPGTNPGHLYQQSSMRDAMVAALSLNIFHTHTARLKMTNIAQMVNVLQSMILTRDAEIVLTPTYHVFRMFNVHQDAVSVPVDVPGTVDVSPSGKTFPTLSVSASRGDALHVSLANPSVTEGKTVELVFDTLNPSKVTGEILVGKGKGIDAVRSHNDFGGRVDVAPAPFKDFKTSGRKVKVTLPPASIVVLEVH